MQEFALRQARDGDLAYLHAFNAAEGMDLLDSLDGVIIAADLDDDPIGYIRVMKDDSGQAYVNPIVVNPLWRRRGVGKALIDEAMIDNASLRLVSRGSAIPFYRSLGFVQCDWDRIEPGYSEDCANCSFREDCGPLPMEKAKA